jgi:hypothetical protein
MTYPYTVWLTGDAAFVHGEDASCGSHLVANVLDFRMNAATRGSRQRGHRPPWAHSPTGGGVPASPAGVRAAHAFTGYQKQTGAEVPEFFWGGRSDRIPSVAGGSEKCADWRDAVAVLGRNGLHKLIDTFWR